MERRGIGFALFLMMPFAVLAQSEVRARNKAAVAAAYQENVAKHRGSADVLVRPGLVADRRAGAVILLAEATGLDKQGNPPEYFLVAEASGHDYESLLISFAKPSDVHAGLEFVGMKAGRPVNFARLQFWPKGERVIATVPSPKGTNTPVRIERLLMDRHSGKSLPETGLVFVGAPVIEPAAPGGQKEYAADVKEPNSIAANYNEPCTVLDVPRNAPQATVYDAQAVNPEWVLPKGALIAVTLRPEYTDGRTRVVDLCLTARPRTPTPARTIGEAEFHVAGDAGKGLDGWKPLDAVLGHFSSLIDAGQEPHVSVTFGDPLTLLAVQQICSLLGSVESDRGIRIEGPAAGQLYYKAFIPPERFRERENRISQPWELRLSRRDGRLSGTLTKIEENWRPENMKPDLRPAHFDVASGAALKKEIEQRGPGLPVILVFADLDVTHGELMGYLGPVLPTHGTVHVYLPVRRREPNGPDMPGPDPARPAK